MPICGYGARLRVPYVHFLFIFPVSFVDIGVNMILFFHVFYDRRVQREPHRVGLSNNVSSDIGFVHFLFFKSISDLLVHVI